KYTDKLDGGATNLGDVVFSANNSAAKRFCSGGCETLDEARRLRNKYCLVIYRTTADWRSSPPDGPWCTCRIWAKRLICPHRQSEIGASLVWHLGDLLNGGRHKDELPARECQVAYDMASGSDHGHPKKTLNQLKRRHQRPNSKVKLKLKR
ncbi:hypothetical protein FOZ61_009807, partial [Perkinsus olseni]